MADKIDNGREDNMMNMPGFTAETSLYRTNNHYRFVAGTFLSDESTTVAPQGCGLPDLLACLGLIGGCIPIVYEACESDPGSCATAWALCLGASYAMCKDCITSIVEGGGGEGGGGGPGGGGVGGTPNPPCPPGTRCCGRIIKVPGQGLICEGDCIGPREECP